MVPLIARATNAAFILHIFAATGEDGRKLMWTDLRLVLSCLAWRKGLQTVCSLGGSVGGQSTDFTRDHD